MKNTGLLSSMAGATETTRYPDVAPDGIVMLIDEALHELIVTAVALSVTTLVVCDAPKPEPEISI